jgi:UDP-N-acetylglucosamine 2-epimerase
MYESHFGLSGSPFQLNPDPAFYFDSRGHSNALAYLKFGAHQGEGFIVVTGEIGAGKTTLVRTLLEGLNPEQVVAAQVVSTQLESGELLQAILMSFGIASASNSKAHLIGSLEAFLTSLAAKGRRALLIIDEAQNLKHEAVEELRMLSNFQLGKYGLLQSFLVGQPELRQLLQSKSMEQLRQRVIASCHLGPLAPAETQAYIEHRLRLVGWANRPEFAPDAFERIHAWTGGVPRKINRLCNRLLLGAFLSNDDQISALLVDRTAGELKSEIGELSEIPDPPPAPEAAERPADKPAAASPPAARAQASRATEAAPLALGAEAALDVRAKVRLVPGAVSNGAVAEVVEASAAPHKSKGESLAAQSRSERAIGAPAAETVGRIEPRGPLTVVPAARAPLLPAAQAPMAPAVAEDGPAGARPSAQTRIKRRTHRTGSMGRPLICLVDSTSDYLKAGTLAEVFLKFPSLPHLIAVHPGPESSLSFGDTGADELPMPFLGLHLENSAGSFALQTCQVLEQFEHILAEFDPHAVLAMGDSDAVLACSLLANKQGTPLFRVAGGQRTAAETGRKQVNGALIDKISDALYVNRMDSYYTLYQEGIKSDRVLCVGNLVGDMLKQVLPHAPSPDEILTDANVATSYAVAPQGFVLVTLDAGEVTDAPKALQDLLELLCELGAGMPVIWLVDGPTRQLLADAAERLQAAGVLLLPEPGYLQLLGLLEKAKCLVCGPNAALLEEAVALRIPSVTLNRDPAGTVWLAEAGSPVTGDAADKPLALIRQQLAQPSPAQDAPTYWDSGTATRIANHLLLWLPKADKVVLGAS